MQAMCARLDLRYPDAQSVLHDLEEFRRNPNIVFPYANPWEKGTKSGAAAPRPSSAAQVTQTMSRSGMGSTGSAAASSGASQPAPAPQRDERMDTITREELEDEQRRKKNRIIFTTAVVAIIVVILLIFLMLWRNFLSGILDTGEVLQVPKLVDMTVDEAKEYIATECGGHFTVTCTRAEFSDTVEVGHIISQTPTGGSTTKSENTTIEVIISSGVKSDDTLYMPSLTRTDYRNAQARLENEYQVEVVLGDRVASDVIDEDLIVSTDPVAGSPLTPGQTVTLYVSKGPEIITSPMPDLIGLTEEQAKAALDQLDLDLGSIVTVASSEKAGTVVYQSVKEKTEVAPGTVVYLQLSDGSLGDEEDVPEEETPEEELPEEETPEEVEPPVQEEPVEPKYQISVQLPAAPPVSTDPGEGDDGDTSTDGDGEEDSSGSEEVSDSVTVTIYVNNEETPCLNASYPRDYGTVTTFYSGEISSVTVYVDGTQTTDFDYVEVTP